MLGRIPRSGRGAIHQLAGCNQVPSAGADTLYCVFLDPSALCPPVMSRPHLLQEAFIRSIRLVAVFKSR
ncbi:hypothetical protein VTI74DRAFT_4940 [Chaetomium olivicolor]